MSLLDPRDYIITRKRKLYKFALFANSPLCSEFDAWDSSYAPSALEVGAGTGLFSKQLAQLDTSSNFLAVDVKADRLQTGARRAEMDKLTNIRFLRSRVDLLPEIIKPRSLASIWVTFPDPFPRDRSAKRRLTSPLFLDIYAGLLIPGGALYFKTDARPLFDWSVEQLELKKWTIQEITYDLHASDMPDNYKIMTTYEKRYSDEGKPISFLKAIPPMLAIGDDI